MNQITFSRRGIISTAIASSLSLLLVFGEISSFTAQAQGSKSAKKSAMTADQRVAHVLSRLTFGARPGDFERVKAMGIEAFINQQLDPDSIDVTPLSAKLRRLPTLSMATPVIIEQYTPPKPAVSPSPALPKPASPSTSQTPNLVAQKPESGSMPPSPAASNETQMDAKKEMGAAQSQKSEAVKTLEAMVRTPSQQPNAAPKPTPPPKNPQMVVTDMQRAKLL